jgi:serine protease inhibitor ecotin
MTSPLDPSQLQMATTQYNKNFKINLIEISNQNFKISIMGSVDQFQDDSMLSGFASIKIQKLDNLVSYLKSEFKNISQAIKSTVKDSSDASQAMQANSSDGQNISVDQNAQVINGTAENKQANSLDQDRGGDYSLLQYSKSLDQIIENMEKVSQEISSKNQLSQNGDCVLDIKRERNLELIINDISVREILGKF